MDKLIAEFQKNALETVRVSLREYKGHRLIDFRVYYRDDNDELRPTRKGVSLSVGLFDELKAATEKLEEALETL